MENKNISLINLRKEKEECDKGCGTSDQVEYEDDYVCCGYDNGYWQVEEYQDSDHTHQEDVWIKKILLCNKCKATSLALSKGIEVAEKQKKMFEEFIWRINDEAKREFGFTPEEHKRRKEVLLSEVLVFIDHINKLAEQLEVKE